MRWFVFILKFLFSLPAKLIFPVKVIGRENLPKKQKYISISNHLSGKDVMNIGLYLRGFRYFLAKKELSEGFLRRNFLKSLGAIFIDRSRMDLRGIKNAINKVEKAPLAIFPEGTRNKSGEDLQSVKGGAAMIAVKSDSVLLPVMIHHKTKLFKKNYMYIAPAITMPYNSNDKFDAVAMQACTELISTKMLEAKRFLDETVATKGFKAYKKSVKAASKAAKSNNRL